MLTSRNPSLTAAANLVGNPMTADLDAGGHRIGDLKALRVPALGGAAAVAEIADGDVGLGAAGQVQAWDAVAVAWLALLGYDGADPGARRVVLGDATNLVGARVNDIDLDGSTILLSRDGTGDGYLDLGASAGSHTLRVGGTNANAIVLGRAGKAITVDGAMSMTSALSLAGFGITNLASLGGVGSSPVDVANEVRFPFAPQLLVGVRNALGGVNPDLNVFKIDGSNNFVFGDLTGSQVSSVMLAGPTVVLTPDGATQTVAATTDANYLAGKVTLNGVLVTNGGRALRVHAVADADYLVALADELVYFTALTGPHTMTLPLGAHAGHRVRFQDTSGQASNVNTVTVAPQGGQLVDGAASVVAISAPGGEKAVWFDGAGWHTAT